MKWIFFLAALVLAIALVIGANEPNSRHAVVFPPNQKLIDAPVNLSVRAEKCRDFVKYMKDQGLLTKASYRASSAGAAFDAVVNTRKWNQLDFDTKQNIARSISCDQVNGDHDAMQTGYGTIYDNMTNKEIATYSRGVLTVE